MAEATSLDVSFIFYLFIWMRGVLVAACGI